LQSVGLSELRTLDSTKQGEHISVIPSCVLELNHFSIISVIDHTHTFNGPLSGPG